VLFDLKRYEEALAAYECAIFVEPNNSNAYNSKSKALKRLGRLKEANQAQEKALQFKMSNKLLDILL
jgi:Flp pilus assembly protein TadD